MDFNNLTLGNGLLVSFFSMLVVFVVLVAISYLIDLTALFSKDEAGKEKAQRSEDVAETPRSVSEDIDIKKAAVIAAVVAASSSNGSHLVIRKIRRPGSGLSGWETAGLKDQLRRPY